MSVAIIVFIIIGLWVVLLIIGIRAMISISDDLEETGANTDIVPCQLDSECGDNEGDGCPRYPYCLEDYEV
jgi:hypothetical protein